MAEKRELTDPAAIAAMKDVAAAQALGALSNPEAAELERAIGRLDELAAELASYREVVAQLATALPPATPPAELKQRVLATVRKAAQGRLTRQSGVMTAPPAEGGKGGSKLAWVLFALALLGAGGAGYYAWNAARRTGINRTELSDAVAARDSLAARLQYREGVLGKVMTPGTTVYQLTGVANPGGQDPVVQVFWVKDRSQWLVNVSHLATAPQGRSYQLWYMVNGQPMPANVFNTDQDGHAFFALDLPTEAARVTQATVTVEPDGGSSAPSTPPILSGAVTQ